MLEIAEKSRLDFETIREAAKALAATDLLAPYGGAVVPETKRRGGAVG